MNVVKIKDFPYTEEKIVIQGTTFIYSFVVKSAQSGEPVTAADPVDLTGHSFDATLINKGVEVASFSVGSGIEIPTPENGQVVLRIESNETATLAQCCHDVRINWTDNSDPANVRRIIHLKLNVTE